MLDFDGGGAPEALLGGHNRRDLAAAWVSQSRSSSSNGFLALFGSRPGRHSPYKHGRMSHLSGECRLYPYFWAASRSRTIASKRNNPQL
jgi:hypothetical protein